LRRAPTATFLLLAIASVYSTSSPANEITRWDGNRTTPVHRLPLLDEEDEEIVPSSRYEAPFSIRNTCGPCHDYSLISGGLHFNSSGPNVSAGRPGEPWVWVDDTTGTQLPISYRGWPGTWRPDELGLTAWRFTQLFGRHMPGGDAAEPEDVFSDPSARWDISGKVEINCLSCHSASPRQDQSEWAIQMARENFRAAATAASGLGDVTGMASRLPDSWTVHDGRNPDDSSWAVPPSVRYDPAQFDSEGRAFFEIASKPLDTRCLHCHSASPATAQEWHVDADVHTMAGISCVDCHRNGLDHMMVRGYEYEKHDRNDPTLADFSCRGCHLREHAPETVSATAGRFGAPQPKHKGLPPVHLEKLACTTCHSGPLPGETPARFRTSRANRLGIYGQAQWDTDAPYIGEPIFIEGPDGRLTPHRIMWPAFWARLEGETVTPLLPDELVETAEGILDAERQVARILSALATGLAELADLAGEPEAEGEAVLVTAGKVYHCNIDGRLDVTPYTGTSLVVPFLWGREKDGEVLPLVPDFDPAPEQLDTEIEERILAILGALDFDETALAEPVVMMGNKTYRRTYAGLIEASEQPDTSYNELTWGWRRNNMVSPLVPEFVVRAVVETAGFEESFSEEQVGLMLNALAEDMHDRISESAEFVYISGGRMFRVGTGGVLTSSDHPAAEPYCWPIAHDVRPAAMSLGAESCTECHAEGTGFFFGNVAAFGPLKTDDVAVRPMHEIQGTDLSLVKTWNRAIWLRRVYVAGGCMAVLLMILALTHYGFAGLERIVRLLTLGRPRGRV